MLKIKKNGFSLVELLIAIAISVVLLLLAFPDYTSFINNEKIKSAQTDLVMLSQFMEMEYNKKQAYPEAISENPNTETTNSIKTLFPKWSKNSDNFVYTISVSAQDSYTLKAKGSAALENCILILKNNNDNSISNCGNIVKW